ncbi:MAG: acyl-CoA desaturase [Proteobacteria bacterium]|nr:acyl-CoA desaturase [Pseudomonadota bacterium]
MSHTSKKILKHQLNQWCDHLNTNYKLHNAIRVAFHLLCCAGIYHYGLPLEGVFLLFCSYTVCMLSLTVGYHRYFAHRSFKVGRKTQFFLGFLGCVQLEGGPLAWAQIHRHHHRHSDTESDFHSPRHGLLTSHFQWLSNPKVYQQAFVPLRDFKSFPELLWLDRYNALPAIFVFIMLWLFGGLLESQIPQGPWSPSFVLFFGGILRTVMVWHGSWSVNSICHVWGSRPHKTSDTSTNNAFIALLTMGEGWHNNHHRQSSCAHHGSSWKEIDLSYLVILLMEQLNIAYNVQKADLCETRSQSTQ